MLNVERGKKEAATKAESKDRETKKNSDSRRFFFVTLCLGGDSWTDA
jgi:hypothetical protein